MWLILTIVGVVAAAVWMFVWPEKEGSFVCPGCGALKLAGEFDPEGDLCLACVALLDDPPEEEVPAEVSVEAVLQVFPAGPIQLTASGVEEALYIPLTSIELAHLQVWMGNMPDSWHKAQFVLVTILGHEIRFTWLLNRDFAFSFSLPAVGLLLAWASQVKERA